MNLLPIEYFTALEIYWFFIASVMLFGASYLWMVWWQVKGIRGLALSVALTCGAIISSCFGILQAKQAIVPDIYLLVIHRAAWWPLMLSGLLLADIYAADHNDHRSLTTRTYLWFKRVTKSRDEHDTLK